MGIVFDAHLSLKAELKRVAEKTTDRTYRVFNHVDWTNGLGVSRLLEIYSIWIESVIAYGSPVWIFQIFPDIRLSVNPAYGYGDLWNELHRLFRGLMRCIDGVPKITNFNAVFFLL